MNLKPGGKLKMGPLWDFDLGFGGYPSSFGESYAAIVNNPEGFRIKGVQWYTRLFEDPSFSSRVRERFNVLYSHLQDIYDHIDTKAAILLNKVIEENKLWGRISSKTATEEDVKNEYQLQIENLKIWLGTRFEWLNSNL